MSKPATVEVEAFYDEFADTFVRDYVNGNPRIDAQREFFQDALPRGAARVLVVGCGSGESAHFVARRVAPRSRVLAVDISGAALDVARRLFPHPRIEYRKLDICADAVEGEWDAILLPDVYEHIPQDRRTALHEHLRRALAPGGRVLLSIPSPAKQRSLYERGEGLQVVDEIVTLSDLANLARAVDGTLTTFNHVSVFERNDYIHAAIERGAEQVSPLRPHDLLGVKGHPRTFWRRVQGALRRRWLRLTRWRRRRRAAHALRARTR